MNKDEAKNLAILCAKLWPNQVTKELSFFAIKNFLPHDANMARKAIENHRAEGNSDGFLNWGRLLEAIRLAGKSADLNTAQVKVMSYADMQRQISPCYVGMNDPQVILCQQRRLWRIALARNPAAFVEGKPGVAVQHALCLAAHRSHIGNECTMLLIDAGMDHNAAQKWTAIIFEESVDYFRQALSELDGWQPPVRDMKQAA